MARRDTLTTILSTAVIPIVRCNSADKALDAARAIVRGGIPLLEVTMTVPGAVHIVEKLADEFGDDLLLGCGTVLDPETARACMLAGAEFFVTPSLNLRTIEICKRYSKPVMPGALTPTEVMTAWEAGADLVKIFPCEAMGGPAYIKALKAPLPQVRMAPTGGVTLENVGAFFAAGADALAVGSSLMNKKALAEGRFEVIEAAAAAFAGAVAKARGH